MDESIIETFHTVSRLQRRALFQGDSLTPITAVADANTAAAGWVGSAWRGGTLLVGINPGGGGDEYRRNASDDRLYACLREFATAESTSEQATAFQKLSTMWMALQKTHNIWRIIQPILAATGEHPDEAAFINILPFRTRMDRPAPATVLRQAWSLSSSRQIAALGPRRIIGLGKKAWDVLSRFQLPAETELILFKRGIGDSYIPAESQEVLRRLAEDRVASAVPPTARH